MTCANILLTVLAGLAIILAAAGVGMWGVIIPAVLIIIVAWTMVDCKPCKVPKKKK